MLAWLSTRPIMLGRLARSPIREVLTGYLTHMTTQGYPTETMRKRARYLFAFGESLPGALPIAQIPQWVEPFLAQFPSGHGQAARRISLNGFLRYLRQTGAIAVPELTGPPIPHTESIEAYCTSLRTLRALRDRSIQAIRRTCRVFMTFLAGEGETSLRSLQPEVIHRFLISRGQQLSRGALRVECAGLRGYLSYLHRHGAVTRDLSKIVVAPRVYQHDQCPRFLTRPQIDTLLAVIDRDTPVGRRDYAMLLLLTVYGLRGIEVTQLRLDDIDWRNRKLHIRRRKVGNNTTYPLATSVDEAIVGYLQNGRPTRAHREVFLSAYAPFRPLGCVTTLACRIVHYLDRAGIKVPRPGTHIFRYSCAQRLFEEGMPLKVIGDYLGHTQAHSTQRYTKIAIDQLREVALGDAEELL
jgi:integrase/recombinase XerD